MNVEEFIKEYNEIEKSSMELMTWYNDHIESVFGYKVLQFVGVGMVEEDDSQQLCLKYEGCEDSRHGYYSGDEHFLELPILLLYDEAYKQKTLDLANEKKAVILANKLSNEKENRKQKKEHEKAVKMYELATLAKLKEKYEGGET